MDFTRDLKYVRFSLDRDKKEVRLENKKSGEAVSFNKTYMFSLLRFLVSTSQKLATKPRVKR